MKVSRIELVKALETVSPAVSSSSIMPTSALVTFQDGKVYTSTDIISICTKFEFSEMIQFRVKHSDLYTTLKRFVDEEIDIACKDASVVIKTKTARASLKTHPINKDSPLYFDTPPLVPLSADTYDAMSSCFIPNNKTGFSGVFFEHFYVMSTDGNRINYADLSSDMPRFWINDQCIKTLIKFGNIFIHYGVTDAYVWWSNEVTTVVTKRLRDESFPVDSIGKYYQACQDSDMTLFDVPTELLPAVMRSSPFTQIEDTQHPIDLYIGSEGITIKTSGKTDEYEEFVAFDETIEIPEEYLRIDYAQFSYGLKKAKKMGVTTVSRNNRNYKIFVMTDANATLMLNTLRT